MKSLIIPMLVEAYAVGDIRTTQKNVPMMAPNYKSALYKSFLGSRNTPSVIEETEPLEAGIHLHFILPDAFTHSVDGKDYPAVPNRFIVTRIWHDPVLKKLTSKCFVIESDFISRDKIYKKSITIPFFKDSNIKQKWRYLGRNYSADKMPPMGDSTNYLDKLTALGTGDPLFNAYYPNCKSVFGFYDDLKDLPLASSIKLTYFVMGYFSKKSDDPFSKVKTADAFFQELKTHKFSVSTTENICDNCVLYGAIDAIDWKGFEAEYCSTPNGKVNVIFGNTSAEALSLAVKKALGNEGWSLTERMLTALQYELYDEKDEYDGNFKIDDAIQFNTFSRFDGFDEKCHLSVDKNIALDIDKNIGREYSDIKKSGHEIGTLNRNLIFEQKKLYSIWEQYVLLYESAEKSEYPTQENMLAEIKKICKNIEQIKSDIRQKTPEYNTRLTNFSKNLPDGANCKKSGNEAFYTAKDPVLLLSGEGIKRTFAFGEDGRFTSDGTVGCQIETVFSNIPKSDVFKQCFSELTYMENLPAMYTDLLFQTAMICSKIFDTIKSIMGQIDVTGEKPSEIAVNEDPFNWTTLYMIWQAEYSPTNGVQNPDNTLSDWDFEYGETDLIYTGGLQPVHLQPRKISGKVLLTPHAVKIFSSVVNRYVDIYTENEELKTLAKKIKDLSIISQNISGFSDYFSGFWNALQFPIIGIDESDEITQMVTQHIGKERQSILADSSLMPVRGGYIKITDLILVSSFGQKQTLVEQSYYNKCEVEFTETVHCDIENYGLLPPSFAVPARLNTDFVSAMNNDILTSIALETSPVCGIIIPEMLNRRLLAYTANGDYLGMVKTVYRDGKTKARWLSAPNLDSDFDSLKIPDDNFKNFLRVLFNTDNTFYEFNELMDKYLDVKQNFGSLIWGRPLALTRLKVNFEFYGHPQFSKKYEDFKKYDTHGSEKIRFKIKFGDIERISDGFLGCFNDNDFSKMFPPFGAKNPYETDGYINYSQSLDISNSDGDRFFTLLIEPSSPLNIQTGILPVKTLHFEPTHTKTAGNLDLFAEISPILGTLGQISLPPLPQVEEKKSYKWYVLDKEEYIKSKMIPPIVSFDETILMDGLIEKGEN